MQIQDLLTANYFAYGANTVSEIMQRRCPSAQLVGTGILGNHQLVFRKFSTVQPASGQSVEGVVWRLSKSDLRQLDRFERVPVNYLRTQHHVTLKTGETLLCWAYEMTHGVWQGEPPDPEYVEKLRKGYREHGLSLEQLERAVRAAAGGGG